MIAHRLKPTVDGLFRLDGRVALLTGATGHLGRAMAAVLGDAGAHVVLIARSQERLEELSRSMADRGYKSSIAPWDVMRDDAVALVDRIEREHGRLDVLVNNAYSGKTGTMQSATPEDFDLAYSVAVTAAFKLMQAATTLLEQSARLNPGGSSVINIASMYGTVSPDPSIYGTSGSNNPPFYGAAKAGLIQLTRYAACHLAPRGIRVNSMSPGPFPPSSIAQTQPEFHAALCRKVPLGRIGLPEELSGPLLFLASDASSYVTGINLPVDGGWTAW